MDILTPIALILLVVTSIFIIYRQQTFQRQEAERYRLIQKLAQDLEAAEAIKIENERLKVQLTQEGETLSQQARFLETAGTNLKLEFENIANRLFREQGKEFSDKHQQELNHLLNPLSGKLDDFRSKLDDIHEKNIRNSESLLHKVSELQNLSNQVSQDANNLSKAIKGNAKRQGGWGEVLIEKIFDASGLEKGRDYRCQVKLDSEDGQSGIPDFVVNLPGNRVVVVDSKISLTNYERFTSAESSEQQRNELEKHLKSVRRHFKALQKKRYDELIGSQSPDFVVMCIPLEPAYLDAINHDPQLVYDSASSNVILTGPTNLMTVLKVVVLCWQRESENRNAEEIAEIAGKIYDQAALVDETMAVVRKKLEQATDEFETMVKRISTGRGNLFRRVDRLRKLGARTTKTLSDEILENSRS